MKYIKQILRILAVSLLGELLSEVIPLPVPAAIYGFILLFLGLCTGILKESHISETADFLISVMGLLFVAPAVDLLAYYEIVAPALVPVCTIVVTSTLVVFAVSGWVTQLLRRKAGKEDG